jgi:hypothetical protein
MREQAVLPPVNRTKVKAPAAAGRAAGGDSTLAAIASGPGKAATATISVKLSPREIELLTSLASDQLFRREFIDPRLPGYRPNAADLSLGKQLVERLKAMSDLAAGKPRGRR